MHRIAPCAPYLPRRASDTNKYDYGRVLIVGGCIGYTGAPTLCARAALRCGAGLVSVGVPEAIYAVTAVKNDEAMPFPLPSAEGKLARDALPVLLERLEKSDVCVLGPGLGRNDTLTALVQAVVMQSGTPLVLDADALFAVAQDAAVLLVEDDVLPQDLAVDLSFINAIAPQQRLHAHQQLRARERLDEIVVAARLIGLQHIPLLALGRQEQDRRGGDRPDLLAGLDAAELRHHDVHQNEVGVRVFADILHSPAAIDGLVYAVALLLQQDM